MSLIEMIPEEYWATIYVELKSYYQSRHFRRLEQERQRKEFSESNERHNRIVTQYDDELRRRAEELKKARKRQKPTILQTSC